jgi:hypothetical protein
MLPPVVVDLGPDVGRTQLEIVLDACNEAIARGVCVPEGSAGDEAPRALALARAGDRTVRVVRIEVRLAGSDGASSGASFVRELRFARRDPVSERWRTVGLAIATLVGEGEQRAREEDAEASAAAPAAAAPGAAEPEPAMPEPPPPSGSAAPSSSVQPEPEPEPEEPAEPPPPPERSEPRPAREPEIVFEPQEPEPPLDWSHRPLFIGLGAVVGSGFDSGTWRSGGRLRGGWHFESGLALLGSVGYALGSAEEPSVAWLTFDAGVGYRFALSERLSVGASLFAGAERARFELPAATSPTVSQSEARFSPRLGLVGDVWWRAAPMFGFWASLEGSTSGRETRVFIAPDREPATSLPVAVALCAGFGFWM